MDKSKIELPDVAEDLKLYTLKNSNFQSKRDYISLSNAFLPADVLFDNYCNGYIASDVERLKCYKGYQMEKDLLRRLQSIYGDNLRVDVEITSCSKMVQGHPDFALYDFPGDCKSVLKDEWLPVNNRLPNKVYYQLQAYMLYSSINKAVIIYESRESGLLWSAWIPKNEAVQKIIYDKINDVLLKIKNIGV
jgi:hypothetical protein